METGRVINGRYLLKRLVRHGQLSTVYQGIDHRLQRTVAVKSVPASYLPVYRTAVRLTGSFSHPNIVGLYDLIVENESLYVVQEYIEGNDFATLLQLPLTPYEVADIGSQICLALMYAGSSSRRVCHGDLTPPALLRDAQGLVRINNFALPSNVDYFTSWSIVGGEGPVLEEGELPWGQQSEARTADDVRAAGLLLYQLLAVRPQGATSVEPHADGRLHFPRTIPAELCQIVARAVVRNHPQRLFTPEAFHAELRAFADTVEPPLPVLVGSSPYQNERLLNARPLPSPNPVVGTGKLVTALPAREGGQPGTGLSAYSNKMAIVESAAPTTADVSLKLAAARQAAFPEEDEVAQNRRSPVLMLLLIGLIIFVLFFIVGYFAGHLFFNG